jgi:hypothetical protein
VKRRVDLGKRILQISVLVGKGKRFPNLFEARGALPIAQEQIGLQGGRKRKSPWIETCGGRPGQEPCPGAFIGREAIKGTGCGGAWPRGGRPRALECHSPGGGLLDFPQARRHFTQSKLFCNNRSY